MNERAICEVMLYSYKDLEKKCRVIDMWIYNKAIYSAFSDTKEVLKDVEMLINEKIAYINTKVIIDKAIRNLNRSYELEQFHFKGWDSYKIADTINEKHGTIMSRLWRQREKLYDEILNLYSGEQLLDIICDSSWLMNRYKRALKDK